MATALLQALRRGFPDAAIDWAVGSTSLGAIGTHPSLRHVLFTGKRANPASRPRELLKLVRLLRSHPYDLVVVPDRSPLLGLATLLARIRQRAGLDSARRGFAYTIKAPINPHEVRHEADIYLDVGRALKIDVNDCWVNVPPAPDALTHADQIMASNGLAPHGFLIVHPGGGVNAGMTMTEKRWPADRFAALAHRLATTFNLQIVVIGTASDQSAVGQFKAYLQHPVVDLTQHLALSVTGALASRSALYIGNDNGVAHLAAASGGKVLMIFGPSDPRRYAPFVPPDRARAVWRQVDLPAAGVSAGKPRSFSWERDGVTVDEAWEPAQALLTV
ncbi:MAG: glycosyltransferase family 9 protein [Anaerolineae bacterium]|nr:glycosyltransferase family 9 protein [Anaerolineae bacterium]